MEKSEETVKQPEKVDYEKSIGTSMGIIANLIMAARRFKSVRRAIKRGHVTPFGGEVSRRPFNNRANTSRRKGVHSRVENLIKKRDYYAAKRSTSE